MPDSEEPFDWDGWPIALVAIGLAILLGLGFAAALLVKGSP
jgi:hypothetical protein